MPAGRKRIEKGEKKEQVSVYTESKKIQALGGIESVRKSVLDFIEKSYVESLKVY